MKRLYHHFSKWECVQAGMYATVAPLPYTSETALYAYAEFLRDTARFEIALCRVFAEWPISCEQFLSNEHINRIAWLGQASMCMATGIPACFRAGFKLLSDQEQRTANETASQALNRWLAQRGNVIGVVGSSSLDGMEQVETVPDTRRVGTYQKVHYYIRSWKDKGYADGIPDEVPNGLMRHNLAPSYKAICFALLQNDVALQSLGFSPPKSQYYGILKRIEFDEQRSAVLDNSSDDMKVGQYALFDGL